MLEVTKVKGVENPADLITKILGLRDIVARLSWINLRAEVNGSELEFEKDWSLMGGRNVAGVGINLD